jgi:pyrroline-5-carboxylate reductase
MQVGFIGSGNMASALARGWGDPGTAQLAEVAEEWADAAIRQGMPGAQAATLVTETMPGTAALPTQTDTLALRRGVTSTAMDAVVRA